MLDLLIDTGPNARSVQVKLNRFTLVGPTDAERILLTAPMRSRFALTCRLDYYPPAVLEQILSRSSGILKLPIDPQAIKEIAKRARGTPRIANNLLRWVRDFAQVRGNAYADLQVALLALEMLSIDERGLDEMGRKSFSPF